jgi:uncharacterized SAM-binding protein YcdF (DUF218 family)
VSTNYLIWLFVKPSQLILLAALVAILCWRRPLGRRFGLLTAALVILFGIVPLGAWLMRPLEARFPTPEITGDVAGVIVLAGAEDLELSEAHSVPQLNAMGNRLTTFLLLAERYPQARLVHSGEPRASRIARELVLGTGVAVERLRFDDQSRNTCDSGRFTRELVQPKLGERWLLVTSALHMPRAVACFRAAGWDIVAYPTDFRRGPNPWHFEMLDNLADLDLAAHEWLGLVYYRLRGYTNDVFPGPAPL